MIRWNDKTIEGETIDVKGTGIYQFGPGLYLKQCKLKFNCSRSALILGSARFYGCVIHVTRKLKNESWTHCYLENCQFTGMLDGHDFGRLALSGYPKDAGIKNCDFIQSEIVNSCRFFNTDIKEVRFASWPIFALIEPLKHGKKLAGAAWPNGMGSLWAEIAADSPPDVSFELLNASWIVEKDGGDLVSFRESLARFPFVVIG